MDAYSCARQEIENVYELLKRKRELAARSYEVSGSRLVLRPEPVLLEAQRRFGKLQRADMAYPPGESAYRAIMESVPALLARQHLFHYRCRGEYLNEILALEGPGGIGKSTLAYYVASFLGGRIMSDEDEILSGIRELIESGTWVPILVLDDIATVISKYWFLDSADRQKWKGLFKAIEYAKDWAGVILLTARSFEGVAKRLRELATLRGEMRRLYYHGYIIDIITWYKTGKRLPLYVDVLWPGMKMPRDAWEEMNKKRRLNALKALGGEENDNM